MYALSIAWAPLPLTTILPAPSVLKASAPQKNSCFCAQVFPPLPRTPNIKAGLQLSCHSHGNQVRQALWAHLIDHELNPQKPK